MIRIYYMNLEEDCSDEQLRVLNEILPSERKESVNRAKNEIIAKKRLYTGAFLQQVLSKETGIPAKHLRYAYNEWGKPELDVEHLSSELLPQEYVRVHFNLSHSGKYAVLAVSDRPIGVDVEHKTTHYDSLAKRCFCEEEYEDIMLQDEEFTRKRRFLEYWTMKEAYIKCLGEGMRIPMNSFLIQRRDDGISNVKDKDMWFGTFFLDEEYCVSVCLDDKRAIETMNKNKNQMVSIDDGIPHIDFRKIYVGIQALLSYGLLSN